MQSRADLIQQIGGTVGNCCGKFTPKEVLTLMPNGNDERYMVTGICPQCNSFVLELHTKDYAGNWHFELYKRHKAQKKYESLKYSIINKYNPRSEKSGNKSNMGFVYGLNIENKNEIKQYSVDFNGTRKLIKSIK